MESSARQCSSRILYPAIAVVIVLGWTEGKTYGQPYLVTDLGICGVDYDVVLNAVQQLNDSGQVVGWGIATGESSQAFLWAKGGIEAVDTLGGPSSQGCAVNRHGWVVGISDTASGDSRAFLWRGASTRDLGTLRGMSWSGARAINDLGQVAGQAGSGTGELHSFLWEDDVTSDLGTLNNARRSSACDINDQGQIVGDSDERAFLWENGDMIDLGTLGGPRSFALAINNQGAVVGRADLSEGESHAFLWQDDVMSDLGILGGCCNSAVDINGSYQIGGASQVNDQGLGSSHPSACLWNDAGIIDLNDVVPKGFSWHLVRAISINNVGQSFVTGMKEVAPAYFEWRYFLMTPIMDKRLYDRPTMGRR